MAKKKTKKAKKITKQAKSEEINATTSPVVDELKSVGTKLPKLTAKQSRFCEEYIIDLNATQAALRAGYCERSVNNIGPANLLKVGIKAELKRLKADRSERTLVTADSVVLELAKLAFSNIEDYLMVVEDGEVYLKNFDAIEREKLAVIESIKVSTTKTFTEANETREYKTTQFKLHSKLNALEQLGKHLGIYDKDNQQRTPKEVFNLLVLIDGSSKGKLPTRQEVKEAGK